MKFGMIEFVRSALRDSTMGTVLCKVNVAPNTTCMLDCVGILIQSNYKVDRAPLYFQHAESFTN